MQLMTKQSRTLLQEIDAFLKESNLKASYLGKAAAGNSELVSRLRAGGRVWPETEAKVRSYIAARKKAIRSSGHVDNAQQDQGVPAKKRRGAA